MQFMTLICLFFREKFQNSMGQIARPTSINNRVPFEIKKKVWSMENDKVVDPHSYNHYENGLHACAQRQSNGMDVSEEKSLASLG